MVKKLILALALLAFSFDTHAAVELDADANGATDVGKGGTNATTAAGARTALGVPATAATLVGDCTVGPCFDGTSDGGTLLKWYGPGGFWQAIQAGNSTANRSWRLPIAAAPSAGTTRLMNMDEYGQMGFVDPATFLTPSGVGGALTVTATGFDGNLTTSDNTLQEIAQKVDDLTVSGGAAAEDTAYSSTTWNADTDAPSKNVIRDYMVNFDADGDGSFTDESWFPAGSGDDQTASEVNITDTGSYFTATNVETALQEIGAWPALTISTGLTENAGTITVTNPVTAEAFSGSGWNADTEGLTRNDAYDYTHLADTDDDGLPNKVDLASAGLTKVDSSGVLSVATVGTDYEASTPQTKLVTSTGSISESDLLAAKYVSNYGAAGTVIMTLPAPAYNISRAIISETAQIIQVKPPSGEALATPIGTQTADEVVSAPASVGNALVATRYKTGASTWAWRVDPVNGIWKESGGSSIYPTAPSLEVDGSASVSLTEAQVSGTIVTNRGMGGADVALTLPTAAAGYNALFTVGTAQSYKWGVRAGTNDKIYLLAADGTIAAGSDNGYARMTAAQVGQSFACWTFQTGSGVWDWQCKSGAIGTSTFAAN